MTLDRTLGTLEVVGNDGGEYIPELEMLTNLMEACIYDIRAYLQLKERILNHSLVVSPDTYLRVSRYAASAFQFIFKGGLDMLVSWDVYTDRFSKRVKGLYLANYSDYLKFNHSDLINTLKEKRKSKVTVSSRPAPVRKRATVRMNVRLSLVESLSMFAGGV